MPFRLYLLFKSLPRWSIFLNLHSLSNLKHKFHNLANGNKHHASFLYLFLKDISFLISIFIHLFQKYHLANKLSFLLCNSLGGEFLNSIIFPVLCDVFLQQINPTILVMIKLTHSSIKQIFLQLKTNTFNTNNLIILLFLILLLY